MIDILQSDYAEKRSTSFIALIDHCCDGCGRPVPSYNYHYLGRSFA